MVAPNAGRTAAARSQSGWPRAIAIACVALLATALLAGRLTAQTSTRRATNLAQLLNYPAFFQLRPILVAGALAMDDRGKLRLSDETGGLPVIYKGNAPEGQVEVRGEFWDIGRMNADDPRLTAIDARTVFQIAEDAPWPRPGQAMAIVATAIEAATTPSVPSIRGMVLFPSRYRDQKVTIVGQYAGRNLLGDLPDAPGRSRYDFVVRSADAAVWVSGIRPKGKDFELALDARIDTGRWIEVTGILQQGRGLQWLDGEVGGTIALAKPPAQSEPEAAPVRVMAAPPPEVVFSAPTESETDVAPETTVRIQFSRDLALPSIKGRVKVEYVGANGAPATPVTDFTTEYRGAARVLEVKFAKPLERFRTVRVSFGDGVIGTDQQALKPWTLTFVVAP